uniref:Uncharacterized protein n=1 Tax=Cacopsylla melanoneura TaxID=428564 RepID=A0A8D8PQ32_9HEMI
MKSCFFFLFKRPGLKPFRTYKSEDSAALPDFTTHQWSYESSTQPRSFDFITQPRATDSPVCKADRYKFTFDNKLKHNQHTLAATLSSDNFSSLDYDLNFTYAKKSSKFVKFNIVLKSDNNNQIQWSNLSGE